MRGSNLLLLAGAALVVTACGDHGTTGDGFTVTELALPAAIGSGEPRLATDAAGAAVASWLEPDGDGGGYALRFSRLGAMQWSEPTTVATGEDIFVNWADVPSVVPIAGDDWVAHWLRLKPDAYGAYDVVTAVSSDAGKTWSEPALLNDDDTETEHGFATMFAWGDAVGAVWLDGRRTAEWSFDRPDELLGTSLLFARLSRAGKVLEQGELDALVCDCCQTDVAMTPTGPIVIYRDRTESEIRDVVVRRYVGGDWLEPQGLGNEGWEIAGCPVNGPAIASRELDVAAVWFTAAGGMSRVRFARSSDGGETFGAPVEIDGDGAFGQADVAILDDGTALLSWWRRGAEGTLALATRTVGPSGELGPIRPIAQNATAQPLDVPETLALGEGVVVSWTGLDDGGRVHTVLLRR